MVRRHLAAAGQLLFPPRRALRTDIKVMRDLRDRPASFDKIQDFTPELGRVTPGVPGGDARGGAGQTVAELGGKWPADAVGWARGPGCSPAGPGRPRRPRPVPAAPVGPAEGGQ